jgi:coatomer protein complex subunit alpha (xenin)
MNLVTDPRARFSLAIDSGNLEVAYKTCNELKERELYRRLAEEALRQGNHQLVDMALQQTRSYEALSFLYLVTGKTEKLEKMLSIAQNRDDAMSRFHNALYLGDVQQRIAVLAETGQLALAYCSAVVHGYDKLAEELRESIENP